MVDLVLPPALRQARTTFRYIDTSGSTRSRYGGGVLTTAYGGDRVGASIDFTPCGGASTDERSRRAQLQSFLMALRGSQNRVWLTDVASPLRGSFPASELFANSEFGNGTAGWSVTNGAISASGGVLRLASIRYEPPALYQDVALTPFAPHVIRSICVQGRGNLASSQQLTLSTTVTAAGTNPNSRGYNAKAAVGLDGTSQPQYPIYLSGASGGLAGDYLSVHFVSLSRCMLVDGGGNLLLRSDELDNAAWTRSGLSGVTADSGVSPDGTSTSEVLVEDSSNTSHYIQQNVTIASAAADSWVARQTPRPRCRVVSMPRMWMARPLI
jgi:hypothetical protein